MLYHIKTWHQVTVCSYSVSIAPSTNMSNCTDGNVRLVDGGNALEGRVEVCVNRAWGTICDDLFNEADSEVICRQVTTQMNTRYNGT